MDFTNKTAIILGCGSEIASTIAEDLLKNGVTVCCQYRTHKPKFSQEYPEKLLYLKQADLKTEKDCEEFIKDCMIFTDNKLNILINTIGDYLHKSLEYLKPFEFDYILQSNLSLSFYLSHHALPFMRDTKEGRIIFFGYSPATILEARENILPYHISKLGVLLLAKSLAQTEAKNNILVNCISPGVCANNQYPTKYPIPLKRPADFLEISEVILFLLESNYITGTEIQVDGGWRGRD